LVCTGWTLLRTYPFVAQPETNVANVAVASNSVLCLIEIPPKETAHHVLL
jgi:hypothetical protein